jgi:hypothetical protein
VEVVTLEIAIMPGTSEPVIVFGPKRRCAIAWQLFHFELKRAGEAERLRVIGDALRQAWRAVR